MQSTEEPTVAQVVKQVVQYSIGRRFDPSHRQRKTEGERDRESGRGRQREGGEERDRWATLFFFFLESQVSRPVGSIPSHSYGMTTLIMGPSNALITCESAGSKERKCTHLAG